MFKKFRETQELKKATLRLQYLLLSKAYELAEGFPDILELAKKASTMDMAELQKLMAVELVKYIKKNETSTEENVTTKTNTDKSDSNVSTKA